MLPFSLYSRIAIADNFSRVYWFLSLSDFLPKFSAYSASKFKVIVKRNIKFKIIGICIGKLWLIANLQLHLNKEGTRY